MSKKIELNLTMSQLWTLRGLVAVSDKNGDLETLYNILDEKIQMNWEPEELNNFPEELNNFEEE